jgi:hypothetical protein
LSTGYSAPSMSRLGKVSVIRHGRQVRQAILFKATAEPKLYLPFVFRNLCVGRFTFFLKAWNGGKNLEKISIHCKI